MNVQLLHNPKSSAMRRKAFTDFDRELGAEIRGRRNLADMTLQDVADRLKLSLNQISRYELGSVTIDTPTLLALAHVIGFSAADVLARYDNLQSGTTNGTHKEPLSAEAVSLGRGYDKIGSPDLKKLIRQIVATLKSIIGGGSE